MKNTLKNSTNELNWKDIELSPDTEDIYAYNLKEANSTEIPKVKTWELRNESVRFKTSRIDSPYYKQTIREEKEVEDKFLKGLNLLDEKNWNYTIPSNLTKKFALAVEKNNDADYEEVMLVLKDIVEYVKEVVGEDEFYEDSLLEDLEYATPTDEDDVNYYINEMYDVLDSYGFWMEPAIMYQESSPKRKRNRK